VLSCKACCNAFPSTLFVLLGKNPTKLECASALGQCSSWSRCDLSWLAPEVQLYRRSWHNWLLLLWSGEFLQNELHFLRVSSVHSESFLLGLQNLIQKYTQSMKSRRLFHMTARTLIWDQIKQKIIVPKNTKTNAWISPIQQHKPFYNEQNVYDAGLSIIPFCSAFTYRMILL